MYLRLYNRALEDPNDPEVKEKITEYGREITFFGGDDIADYHCMYDKPLIFLAKHYLENPDDSVLHTDDPNGEKVLNFIIEYFLNYVKEDTKLGQKVLKEAENRYITHIMEYVCEGIHTPFIYKLIMLSYDEILEDLIGLKNVDGEIDWCLDYSNIFEFFQCYDSDKLIEVIQNIGEFALSDTEKCVEGCCYSWNDNEELNDKWKAKIKEVLSL